RPCDPQLAPLAPARGQCSQEAAMNRSALFVGALMSFAAAAGCDCLERRPDPTPGPSFGRQGLLHQPKGDCDTAPADGCAPCAKDAHLTKNDRGESSAKVSEFPIRPDLNSSRPEPLPARPMLDPSAKREATVNKPALTAPEQPRRDTAPSKPMATPPAPTVRQ